MSSTPITRPMLTRRQAREHYDRRGRRPKGPARFERKALDRLIEVGDFGLAESVVEFGCGDGSLAQRLMEEELPMKATYAAFDVSDSMVQATRTRLVPFGSRVSVTKTDGRPRVPLPPRCCDRYVATYVIELLSTRDIGRTLSQAWQLLRPEGLLCLTSLTYGSSLLSRLIVAGQLALHTIKPSLVGGRRPLSLADYLGPASWKILYQTTIVSHGIPSEVLVARPRAHSQGGPGAVVLDPK